MGKLYTLPMPSWFSKLYSSLSLSLSTAKRDLSFISFFFTLFACFHFMGILGLFQLLRLLLPLEAKIMKANKMKPLLLAVSRILMPTYGHITAQPLLCVPPLAFTLPFPFTFTFTFTPHRPITTFQTHPFLSFPSNVHHHSLQGFTTSGTHTIPLAFFF